MQDKWVFISGASGGIGTALLKSFASKGYCIIAHARKPRESFVSTIEKIQRKYSVSVVSVYFDMCDEVAMKATIQDLYKKRIYPSVLINNAGVAHGGLFQMTPVSQIKEVFEVNLFSAMKLTQFLIKGMMRVEGNRAIVNIASIAGIDLLPGNSAYGVSKAAVIAWTKTLAGELGGFGIRVNAVAPGLTDTNMSTLMEKKAGEEMIKSSSMKRLAKSSEIATTVVFLAGEEASFVNGETLRVDGGKTSVLDC